MKINNIPNSLFVKNRALLLQQLPNNSVVFFTANELMPRNGDQFFPFRQQSDFFYLTGIEADNAYLIIGKKYNGAPIEILFIEDYNFHKAIWQGAMLDSKEATDISGIIDVRYSSTFDNAAKDIVWQNNSVIYLNDYEYPGYNCPIDTIQKRFIKKIRGLFPLNSYSRIAPILNELRMTKSQEELSLIQHACKITKKAFDRCLQTVRPNRYEYEIQAEIEYVFKLNNANGHAYHPIIAGGKNACCLHYSKNNDILRDGDLLLFDIGCEYKNYSSDLSRTIPINGIFTPRQKECYNAVLRVMKEITSMYRPGATIDEINKATYHLMEKEMIALGLFSDDDVRNQHPDRPLYRNFLMHGISHHIGLDVHDSVDKLHSLEPGMVLTCEPGLYIQEENIGIRIENDLLITDDEPVNLFENVPIEVDEIEDAMHCE